MWCFLLQKTIKDHNINLKYIRLIGKKRLIRLMEPKKRGNKIDKLKIYHRELYRWWFTCTETTKD